MFNQSTVFCGLGTYTTVVPVDGLYFVEGKLSLPTLTNGGGISAVVVTINKNGSPIYTGVAGAEGFYTTVQCAAADSLAVVLSSSADADQGKNAIKTTIGIGTGT